MQRRFGGYGKYRFLECSPVGHASVKPRETRLGLSATHVPDKWHCNAGCATLGNSMRPAEAGQKSKSVHSMAHVGPSIASPKDEDCGF